MTAPVKEHKHVPTKNPIVLLGKCLAKSSDLTKAEQEDLLHWVRQILGIVIGLVFSIFGVTGWMGIAACVAHNLRSPHLGRFLAIAAFVPVGIFAHWLNVDEELLGGRKEVLKEGLFTAFFTFVVSGRACVAALTLRPQASWIIFTTLLS